MTIAIVLYGVALIGWVIAAALLGGQLARRLDEVDQMLEDLAVGGVRGGQCTETPLSDGQAEDYQPPP